MMGYDPDFGSTSEGEEVAEGDPRLGSEDDELHRDMARRDQRFQEISDYFGDSSDPRPPWARE